MMTPAAPRRPPEDVAAGARSMSPRRLRALITDHAQVGQPGAAKAQNSRPYRRPAADKGDNHIPRGHRRHRTGRSDTP